MTKKTHQKKKSASGKKTPKRKKKPNRWIRQFVLTLIGIVLPLAFMALPRNQLWIDQKFVPYFENLKSEWKPRSVEERRAYRHGTTYAVVSFIEENVPKGSYLLLPPQKYLLKRIYTTDDPSKLKDSFIGLSMTSIFYYHTADYKLVHMTSPDSLLQKAEYVLLTNSQRKFVSVRIKDEEQRQAVLTDFQQYLPWDARNLNSQQILDILNQ